MELERGYVQDKSLDIGTFLEPLLLAFLFAPLFWSEALGWGLLFLDGFRVFGGSLNDRSFLYNYGHRRRT